MSISARQEGAVAIVSLCRPERRNAVDGPTALALEAALREQAARAEIKALVLWGEGGHFCAGADLKAIVEGQCNPLSEEGPGPMGASRLFLEKPVIAAIAGAAVAGGLELACWCDLRVVEEGARLGVLCRRWGVPLIDGGTWRLPRIVGLGRALDLILTGREIGAAEALAMGLANRVVPEGQALPAALELAHQLSALPQLCMRADRESLYRGLGLPEAEGLREEFRRGQAALQAEGLFGAARFASGEGRHGSPAGAELGREGSRRSAAEADPDQIAGNGPRPPDGELRLIR